MRHKESIGCPIPEKRNEISFGGIPNSSSINIPMLSAIFDYMGAFLRNNFAYMDNIVPITKIIIWLILSRLQSNKPHRNSPQPSEPCLRNLHQYAPELFGTLWNLPNPASGTYTNTRRNPPEPSGTFRDLPEPTFRNLPELASGTYTIFHRNSPEPSGTCLRNLHHFTPELSGTFRNLPSEPTPAHAGTLQNLPEPSSGTCSCGPRRHTPELIWAEDPISLRSPGTRARN